MTLDNPAAVQERLQAIEAELGALQNELEDAALDWYRLKRDKEKRRAELFIASDRMTVADRTAFADRETADMGKIQEGAYEALKAKYRVLDTRAAIGMAILKAQGQMG